MEKKSDLELIVLAKSSDNEISSKAIVTLWNRYQYFIQKKYFQWKNTFYREKVDFEDFMQEAYLAMFHAIELCDINRLKEKNVNNFSTVFYFQLIKIKNKYDVHYEKYGDVITYSSMISSDNNESPEERFSGSNTISGQWIAATSVDSELEVKKYMYEQLLNEYKSTLDSIDSIIYQLMLERNKISNIARMFAPDLDEGSIRKRVVKIKSDIKALIEKQAYV